VKVVHIHRIRGIGGSERHLLTLLPALAERGHDPLFVGLDDPAWDAEPFYRALRVPFVRLRAPRDVDPRLFGSLRRELRRIRPDLVHTHLVHADVYGTLAAEGPVVSTKHNDDRFRTGAFRHVERALARRVARVIAITRALARFTVERVGLPAEKVDVVHYGLDATPAAWSESLELPLPDGARVVLAVCRLTAQKGVDVAVRALAEVKAEHGDAVLVVLGEGPERPSLERLVGELGLADAVFLPGRTGDVTEWLERAEVVVHPVRWEGFGLALLEAMLAARPLVASDVSSIPEIVLREQTGLLVPPDDPAALATGISRLLADHGLAESLGAGGLARARSEFSVDRMATGTLRVYERALARPSAPFPST
jgi:glycosyltransferase involved in cell wall biosynthesis